MAGLIGVMFGTPELGRHRGAMRNTIRTSAMNLLIPDRGDHFGYYMALSRSRSRS